MTGRRHHSGPTSTGDLGDPVADEIRRQQRRDAMPVEPPEDPFKDAECEQCGCPESDKLDRYEIIMPDCSAVQRPPEPFRVLCVTCATARPTLRQKAIKGLEKRVNEQDWRDDPVAVVRYECGRAEHAMPKDEPDPYYGAVPSMPIKCRCGEPIDEVILAESSEVDVDDNSE